MRRQPAAELHLWRGPGRRFRRHNHGVAAGLPPGIVNSGIIGAFAKASGLVDIDTLARAIEEEFTGKKPELNAKAARIAYEHTSIGE